MRLDAVEDRMIVISDLHLGNPYSLASGKLRTFIDHVVEGGYSLCINGDGLDILQSRFAVLSRQALEVIDLLQRLLESGLRVYYVVGNHDTALEHVLNTWLGDYLTPFLNVRSGEARVRIEHGHVYDAFYVASPRLYEWAGAAAAPLLRLYPDVYKLWSGTTRVRIAASRRWGPTRDRERTPEQVAAEMLVDRGFDVVVFGHTHRPERLELPRGAVYVNSGNWLRNSTFVELDHGRVELLQWVHDRAMPFRAGDDTLY